MGSYLITEQMQCLGAVNAPGKNRSYIRMRFTFPV